ncbi:hypothetical protein G3578_17510 [Brevibacillus sp. SYP-B805]|uniref:hypothetical protein n=1 Tax=Brevibacillus sp. SYP-B805 TaxID=1578199 RepID=UPI0013EB7A11|nr:hypothetical protein [Brevibacillus sp. SYP-B805]NGQ96963.1 hypothetical protein [Brevibacillus sp. SYP-B805]
MDWLNEQQLRRMMEQLDGFEPDKAFVKKLEMACLEKIRSMQHKRQMWRIASRSTAAAVCLFLLVWLFSASGQKVIQSPLHSLMQQQAERSSTREWSQEPGNEQHPPSTVGQQEDTGNLPPSPTAQANGTSTQGESVTPDVSQAIGDQRIVTSARQFLGDLVGERNVEEYRATAVSPRQPSLFDVSFSRFVNGVPVSGSKMVVTVDSMGTVKRLIAAHPIDQQAIAQARSLITHDQLTNMVASRLRLYYSEKSSSVVYVLPKLADLDARSGHFNGLEDPTSSRYPHPFLLKVEPQQQMFAAANPQEASDLLRTQTGIDVSGLSFAGVQKVNGGSRYVWKQGQAATVSVETAGDGRITHFSFTDAAQTLTGRRKMIRISEADARDIAVRFLARHLPLPVTSLYVGDVNRRAEDSILEFRFHPALDKIPVLEHPYIVTMDMTDGRIIGFSGDFASIPHGRPEQTNIMTGTAVIGQYFAQSPPALVCTPGSTATAAPDFIYSLPDLSREPVVFDARTGKRN